MPDTSDRPTRGAAARDASTAPVPVPAPEPATPAAPAREPEPKYSRADLMGDAREMVGASRPAIAGAIALAEEGKEEFTIDEVKGLVDQFKKRKVERDGDDEDDDADDEEADS